MIVQRWKSRIAATYSGALILILVLACAVHLGVRLYGINDSGLDMDEVFAWRHTGPLKYVIFTLATMDNHPPFYFLFQTVWTKLLGTGEIALRLPSTIFSVLTLLLFGLCARSFQASKRTWFMISAAVLFALLPYDILLSRYARSYTMAVLLCSSFSYFLFRVCVLDERRYLPHSVVFGILAIYTHNVALLYVVAAVAAGVVSRPTRPNFITGVKVALILAIAYVPWSFALPFQIAHNAGAFRIFGHTISRTLANTPIGKFLTLTNPYPSSLDNPLYPAQYSALVAAPDSVLAWLGLAIALAAFGIIAANSRKIISTPLARAFLLQGLFTLLLMALSPSPVFTMKTISLFLFPIVFLLSFALSEFAQGKGKLLSAGFLILFAMVSLAGFPYPTHGPGWKGACEYLATAWQKAKSPVILISPGTYVLNLEYQIAHGNCKCFNPLWVSANQPMVLRPPFDKLMDLHIILDTPRRPGVPRPFALIEDGVARAVQIITEEQKEVTDVFYLRAGQGNLDLYAIEKKLEPWAPARERFGHIAIYHLKRKALPTTSSH